MTQHLLLTAITPLEVIGLVLVAVGIFFFFRACWQNIQQSSQDQFNNRL